MPVSYITVPRGEYQSLVREVRRGFAVCAEIGKLRFMLQMLAGSGKLPKDVVTDLREAADACDSVSRLIVELTALERRLQEFDQELTPVRPPSRQDIKAAFDNSVDFASGKRKP